MRNTQRAHLYRILTAPYRYTQPYSSPDSCVRKKRFSERTARRIVAQMRTQPRTQTPTLLNAYACGYCHRWHVGNSPAYHFSGKLRIEEKV